MVRVQSRLPNPEPTATLVEKPTGPQKVRRLFYFLISALPRTVASNALAFQREKDPSCASRNVDGNTELDMHGAPSRHAARSRSIQRAGITNDAVARHTKRHRASMVLRLLRAAVTTKYQPLSVRRASEAGGQSGQGKARSSTMSAAEAPWVAQPPVPPPMLRGKLRPLRRLLRSFC